LGLRKEIRQLRQEIEHREKVAPVGADPYVLAPHIC
jgi:hypothetical protein